MLAVHEAAQRVSSGTKNPLSYWGMVAAAPRRAVTILWHRLQPELQRVSVTRMRAGRQRDHSRLPLHLPGGAGHHRPQIVARRVAPHRATRHGMSREAALHAEKRLTTPAGG